MWSAAASRTTAAAVATTTTTRWFLPAAKVATGITVVGGGLAWAHRIQSDDGNILIPTMQATARVVRLVGTCLYIVKEYQCAGTIFSSIPNNMNSNNEEDVNPICTEEREYWDQQVTKLLRELEKAQETYASKNSVPANLDLSQRIIAKQTEKKQMERVAEELAYAEQQLGKFGDSPKARLHQHAATRLLELCHANRGVYIKVGQHLANLDYLIPPEYISVLSKLYDDNPVSDYQDVCHVITEDLGKPPEELFDHFETVPIASASLAQVHVAYDKVTKRKLAVKVQHRGLRETSAGDLFSLVTAVRIAERLFPDSFSYGWIADEIAPNLPLELDFQREGRNSERAAQHLQTTGLPCVVPKIIWEKTSPRVLTMEFEEGFKVNDIDKIRQLGWNPAQIAKLVSSVFASQVFESGFVHCDPHEANVLLRPSSQRGTPELVLVDHGLYKTLDSEFRRNYARLWKGIFLANLPEIRSASADLGIHDSDACALFAGILTSRPFDEIVERSKSSSPSLQLTAATSTSPSRTDFNHPNVRGNGSSSSDHQHQHHNRSDQVIIRGYAQRYLPNILQLLSQIPRQMLLLLKMNDCLRHIDFRLGIAPTNTIFVTGHYAAKAVYRDTVMHSQSMRERWHAWWNFVSLDWRIRWHEWTVWWIQTITGKLIVI
jgi:aarF domain-containing kinase